MSCLQPFATGLGTFFFKAILFSALADVLALFFHALSSAMGVFVVFVVFVVVCSLCG